MATKRFDVIEHTSPCQHIRQNLRATSTSQCEVLDLAVKQYRPIGRKPRPEDVSILAVGSLSMPKEMYEPLWEALDEQISSQFEGACDIRSIWSFDLCNQGASGVLNEHKLGSEPSYFDFARDLLLFVNLFRHELPGPLVGFGHSLGGTIMLDLSLLHPRLISALVLVEPGLLPSNKGVTFSVVLPMTIRKDTWPSREAAVKAFLKNPLYSKLDPRTIDMFQKYGLRELPTLLYPPDSKPVRQGHAVTLTTTKHQEVLSFARSAYPTDRDLSLEEYWPSQDEDPEAKGTREPGLAFYRSELVMTYKNLQHIRPSCFYMYGDRSHWQVQNGKEGARKKRELTGTGIGGSGGEAAGRVKDVVLPGGHFLPLETPDVVARSMAPWIVAESARWLQQNRKLLELQNSVALERRGAVSDDWLFWAKKQYEGRGIPPYQPDPKAKI